MCAAGVRSNLSPAVFSYHTLSKVVSHTKPYIDLSGYNLVMSMERSMWRNIVKNSDSHLESRLIIPDETQKGLTERWVLPYQEAIVEDVAGIRKEVDRDLLKDPEIRAAMRFWDRKYPEGMCGDITVAVIEKLHGQMHDRSQPGLQALKNFVRQGGVMHGFWGVDKGVYFQNAIQIGNAILDVANDTVDRTKPPVVFHPHIDSAPIKNIEDFTEFATVAESYWKADVYPNIYFPHLAPVFPAVSIIPPRGGMQDEWLQLETDPLNLVFQNATTLRDNHMFGLSSDFIFKSPYSEKRLPEAMLSALFESALVKRIQAQRPGGMFDLTADPDKAKEVIQSFHFDSGMDDFPKSYDKEFEEIEAAGNFLRHVALARVRNRFFQF